MRRDEHEDILHRDYVLVLQNDGDFYRKVEKSIKLNDYSSFRRVVCLHIELLSIHTLLTRYYPKRATALVLWDYYGRKENADTEHDKRQIETMASLLLEPSPAPPVQLQPQPQPLKETTMSKVNKIEVITFVNNVPAKDMSDDQLIQTVREAEEQINDLAGIKTPSKKLDTKRADLQKFIEGLVEILDAR